MKTRQIHRLSMKHNVPQIRRCAGSSSRQSLIQARYGRKDKFIENTTNSGIFYACDLELIAYFKDIECYLYALNSFC